MKLGSLCKREKIVTIENVMKKCVYFENDCQSFAVTLLHNS